MFTTSAKSRAANKALQVLIIKARSYAYGQDVGGKLIDILDRAEYLCALIYDDQDRTTEFQKYLKETAEIHECLNALESFDH